MAGFVAIYVALLPGFVATLVVARLGRRGRSSCSMLQRRRAWVEKEFARAAMARKTEDGYMLAYQVGVGAIWEARSA